MLGALKAIIAVWQFGRIRPSQPVAGSELVRPSIKARVCHGTPYEHGMAWVRHAQASVNPDDFGLVLFEDAMELYLGMLDERGWAPRSWEPRRARDRSHLHWWHQAMAPTASCGGKKARRRTTRFLVPLESCASWFIHARRECKEMPPAKGVRNT